VKEKIIIFTGSSDGIGKVAALKLINDGATVIFACRNQLKTESVINSIKDEKLRKNAIFMQLDLSSFKSVKNFAEEFKSKFGKLDILVNNAACINKNFLLTEDNIELTLQANTFSPILLTYLLEDYIKSSKGKVINLTGKAFYYWNKQNDFYDKINLEKYDFERTNYSGITQYCYSKIGNVWFTLYLHDNSIKSAVVHPGVIETNIKRDLNGFFYSTIFVLVYPLFLLFSKDTEMGSQPILHLCYAEGSEFQSGEYYEDASATKVSPWVKNEKNVSAFMKFAINLINHYAGQDIIKFQDKKVI
jgi:NAD(P)-dependent dehydrogenase (short-subunit alcohol dehydrogenase family)